ncbi:MAG: hypothetical protein ABSB49_02925 [Polyangia bacterium]
MMTGRGIIALILGLLLVGLLYQGPALIRSKGWCAPGVGVVAMITLALAAEVGLGLFIRADLRLLSIREGEPVFELRGPYWGPAKNTLPRVGDKRVEIALGEATALPNNGAQVIAELIRSGSKRVVVAMRRTSPDGYPASAP